MCPHADLILGSVTALDLEAQTAAVETDDGPQTVGWSELVLALGAVPRTLPIPGLAEHALSLQDAGRRDQPAQSRPAKSSRQRTQRPTIGERARRLTFVFVGAGYAGVEALVCSPTSLTMPLPATTRG